jgi:hypothetical protein
MVVLLNQTAVQSQAQPTSAELQLTYRCASEKQMSLGELCYVALLWLILKGILLPSYKKNYSTLRHTE